jgi:hypothetical protein
MTVLTLLEGLRNRGAEVCIDGADLEITAPPGVLKPRVLDLARRHKAEILQLLDLETRSRAPDPPPIPPADGLQRRDDVEALDLLDQATKNGHGGDRKSEEINVYNVNVDIINTTAKARPDGTSEAAALRRIKPALRKDLSAIDLHELALTLAHADKREKSLTSDVYRPARVFYPRDVYQPEKAKGDC